MSFNRNLFIILSGLFIVMVGLGLTLPVLPYFIQRLSTSEGITQQFTSFHVGLLTGLYALMQFLFSPIFGILSDRIGRKPLIIWGMFVYSLSLLFFTITTNLLLFYVLRIVGGIFSAAFLTGSIAYIADVTSIDKRGRGMALYGSFVGLGLVAGPFIGSFFSQTNFHLSFYLFDFIIDKYTVPFLLSGLFSIVVSMALLIFLKESKEVPASESKTVSPNIKDYFKNQKWSLKDTLIMLLLLSFLSQFTLAMFEGTFAIHSQRLYNFDLEQISIIFAVCGGVMGLLQLGPVSWLIEKKGESSLLPFGLIFMGIGISLLMSTQQLELILIYVSVISVGMALLTPSLASLVSKESQNNYGISLGIFSSVNSLAQATGVLFGGITLIWYTHLSYWLTSFFLIVSAILIFIKQRYSKIAKEVL